MKIPSILLGTAVAGAAALATTAVVVPTVASSASECDAALFTIRSGQPGAGAGYAKAQVSARCTGANLVVTSNGIARFALNAANAQRPDAKLATAAWGVIVVEAGEARVEAWNLRAPA